MKARRYLAESTTAFAVAVGIGGSILQQLQGGNAVQQTITTSSTRIVVVVIPGFPLESVALGSLLGLVILSLLRRRKLKHDLNSRLR